MSSESGITPASGGRSAGALDTTDAAIAARLRDIPYIEHFALIGGEHDVLALVRAPDNAALRDVVLDRIQDIPGVRSSRTWLVFEEQQGRGVPWDPADDR